MSITGDADLGRRIVKGATWMIMQRMAVRIIGLVSTIVLARLLLPADFGIVALATSISAALELLLELGFDIALIQNQKDGRARYNTAWTLSIIRGLIAGVILLSTAHPVAEMYSDDRLVAVMRWLAFVAIVSGFQNIGIVEFRRDLQFDREFRLLVWCKIAGFIVTLTYAWIWRDYRALLAGIVTARFTLVLMSYLMHPHRPRLSLAGARGFVHFSKWLFVNNVVVIIKQRLDTFVVGKIAGTEALGLYNVGYEISNLTMTELISPISRVLLSAFAKISDDRPRLARSFIDTLAIITFLAAPVAVGIALTAPYIVGIFLGERWLSIVPLVRILTLYGLLNLSSANSGALYLALGRPDLSVWRNLPSIAVLIPGLILGVEYRGAEGAAWALVGSAVVNFLANYWLIRRELGVGIGATLLAVWRPFAASAVMYFAVTIVERHWTPGVDTLHLVLQLVALAAWGAAVYAAALVSLWYIAKCPAGPEKRAIMWITPFFSRERGQEIKTLPVLKPELGTDRPAAH